MSQDNSAGVDPSKGSQTRAFPSYTYTGRNGNQGNQGNKDAEDDYESQPNNNNNNKYRSSYRQVDSRERDDGDRRSADPYDDSNYYGSSCI